MKNSTGLKVLLPLLIGLVLTGTAMATEKGLFRAAPAGTEPIPGVYIVQLSEGAVGAPAGEPRAASGVRELSGELARGYDLRVTRRWSHALTGFVAEMTEDEARRLARHPYVESVEQDFSVKAISSVPPDCYDNEEDPVNSRPLPVPFSGVWLQSIACSNPATDCQDNWGLDRIDQRQRPVDGSLTLTQDGSGVNIFIFDTGIGHQSFEHREFQKILTGVSRVDRTLGRNFTSEGSVSNTNDQLGHGTHVAAIAAGRTYGVAKDATLIPLKVCIRSSMCDTSDVIAGFNHAYALKTSLNGPAVGNFSANSSAWTNNFAMITAIQNLAGVGVQLVQSAGNKNQGACNYSFGNSTQAIVAGGVTVSDRRYKIDEFVGSNYGPCVDLWAPAQQIVSASHIVDNRYCMLTGTSMAAPHVTGALALRLAQAPSSTPAQLKQWVTANATSGVLSGIGSASPNLLLYLP